MLRLCVPGRYAHIQELCTSIQDSVEAVEVGSITRPSRTKHEGLLKRQERLVLSKENVRRVLNSSKRSMLKM
ncbi:hypothetical protein HBH98_152700 [Parastagonospora nodorum]|nr:hypothetical protein HBH53_156290 [Parastagonospora nodorum]KAH4015582.1 hypothetical protein HBI09_206150 [Parastagonospora nodorum]KAH4063256.1 hypothetical protein HBH50_194470 [Parastagonospora nodorum]KAH4082488.1 hypothetical protein HBH48_186950 [Parastagonospora nodorum]KAH4104781.1 hypothetical protein HBH46_092660 [Parastagonospora nodorum]